MKLFDFSFDSPAENLACDEALLDWCEENDGEEILRFWESPEMFVVVGYANKIAAEVNVAACEVKKIPILRRCSGGGTVLQGKGCLNYALILRIAENSPLASISSANKFIMERNRQAIESALVSERRKFPLNRPADTFSPTGGEGQDEGAQHEFTISIRGHTDLTFNLQPSTFNLSKKFSGNSQRRHKNFLLFHGTFLLDFNLALVGEFLQMPSKQPDYRKERSHENFLANSNLSADNVKTAMQKIWKANAPLENPPLEKISKLTREKYSTDEWNFKF